MIHIKKNLKEVFISVWLGIVVFALIDLILMSNWYNATGIVLRKNWTVESTPGRTADVPYIEYVKNEGTIILSNQFTVDKPDDLGVVVPFVTGTAFSVYINEEFIGGIGKVGGAEANIWHSSFVFPVRNAHSGSNTIRFEIYGIYDIGFRVPPYITNYHTAVRNVYVSDKLRSNLILLLGGVSMAFGLMLLVSYWKYGIRKKPVLYGGVVGLLTYFAVVDCIYDVGIGSIKLYLISKKLHFAAMFAILAILTLIFNESRSDKIKHIAPFVWGITALSYMPILVSRSFYEWHHWMWISFALQGINIAVMIFLVLSSRWHHRANFITLVVIFLTFIQGVMSNLFRLNVPNPLQVSFIAVTLTIAITLMSQINWLYNKNKYLNRVSQIDSLTGAYNRRILDHVNANGCDSIVLLDIDRFKIVNDTKGHKEGDDILKRLVSDIFSVTRETDRVIRMGGDEFCIIFKECGFDIAKQKMDTLAEQFVNTFPSYGIGISYGIVMFEQSFEHSLQIADALMYEMKRVKAQDRT